MNKVYPFTRILFFVFHGPSLFIKLSVVRSMLLQTFSLLHSSATITSSKKRSLKKVLAIADDRQSVKKAWKQRVVGSIQRRELSVK